MNITQLSTLTITELIKYLKSQTTAELKAMSTHVYVKRYIEYDISFDRLYNMISNITIQRNMDGATKSRVQSYGMSR